MIPFYGATNKAMFAIERRAMDRPGHVLQALDERLPAGGLILDVGAGDGFTAERIASSHRSVVGLEPAAEMIDQRRDLPWVRGLAQALPFANDEFDGAYSTWAYFFHGVHDVSPGLDELTRVTKTGHPVIIIDNAGGDEFCAMAARDIAADLDLWGAAGFDIDIIETAFVFDTLAEAETLLTFYFGTGARPELTIEYRVAVMTKRW